MTVKQHVCSKFKACVRVFGGVVVANRRVARQAEFKINFA